MNPNHNAYVVTLSYPVEETIEGLGTVRTTACERWFHDSQVAAYETWKLTCHRLADLGLWAQVDLTAHGVVTNSKANAPAEPLDHPLVAELEWKLRAQGRRM
jgi:hypothetical protein